MLSPSAWLWVVYLAAVAQLDGGATLAGASVSGEEMAVLPHGRGVADLLDVTLVAPVSSSVGGGGIDLFDPLQLSVHGYSWTQLHHCWGDVDLDDPAQAGQPLLQLPLEATGGLVLQDGWSPRPTLSLHTPVLALRGERAVNQVRLHGAWGQNLGGGAWTVPHLFDRDPAFDAGAPRARRSLRQAREGRASSTVQIGDGTLFLLGERLEHQHHYLSLQGPEQASRDTAVLAYGRTWLGWPVQVRMAYQGVDQGAAGAAWRWPAAWLQRRRSRAWVLQGEAARALGNGVLLQLAAGVGGREEQQTAHQGGAKTQDLLDQWLQLARPTLAQNAQRLQATAKVRISWRPRAGAQRSLWGNRRYWGPQPRQAPVPRTLYRPTQGALELPPALLALGPPESETSAPGAVLAVEVSGKVQGYRRQIPVDRGPFGLTDGATALQFAQLEGPHQALVRGGQLRAQLSWNYVLRAPRQGAHALGPVAMQAVGGVHLALLNGPLQTLTQAAPALGVAVRSPVGPLAVFALLRREPDVFTSQVGDALGGDAASGSVYGWTDANQDGLPQLAEAGARQGSFGGLRHARSAALPTPSHHLLQLGAQLPFLRGWSAGVRGTVHVLRSRYVLRSQTTGSTGQAVFVDPGGDGRGERRAQDGHQRLAVRTEVPGSQGSALAQLHNGARASAYYGVELELHSPRTSPVFLAVLAAAYLSAGEAPFGNFADRNDPGIVSEASVGLNDGVHAYGRYDHDRSFALKVQVGVRPLAGLSVALAGRYRDGQPFTRLVVDRTHPAAPQALMATGRGGARYTFRMAWDLRLRYATAALRPFGITVVADVYNLLNSATEIDEDPRTGPTFRRALEAVPARSGWVGVEVAFLP